MRLKGRHWFFFWLAAGLAALVLVTARQSSAHQTAGRLRELRSERGSLEARRADLDRRIRQASSREVLGRKVESGLELHQPADSEFVLFSVPSGHGESKR